MGQAISIQQGSEQLKTLEVSGFRVTSVTFPSRLYLPFHHHEVACFAIVLKGAVDKIFSRRNYELPTASVVTMPAQERHCDQFAVGGAMMLVVEPVAVAEDILRPCANLFDLIYQARDKTIAAVAYRIRQELQQLDTISPLVINGLVFELLTIAVRRRKPTFNDKNTPPHWLKIVHDYLHTYYQESIQLADVAQEIGVHPVHLSRVFRDYHGLSIGEYVRRLRLDWVTYQLTLSTDSLAFLAQKAGFADQSHLTRAFKQYKGITPGQYRRTMAR